MRNPMTLPSTRSAIPHRSASGRQAGLTLVEIMIALTLGLIVLLAVGSIYLGSRQTYRVQEDNARLQEAGRYALEVIGRSIRQAGGDEEMNFNPVAMPLACGALPPAPACVAIAGTNGVAPVTDTLTVQFYAGREELDDDTAPGGWVSRDCTGGQAAAGTRITNAFDLSGTDLRCTGSVGGAQALISDIEDLQVVYGINADGDQFQSADRYVAAPSAAQWPRVVTARVCVQVRSANNGLTTAAQSYLNCAGTLTTAGDRRLHRSFVATYNLRNRINVAP